MKFICPNTASQNPIKPENQIIILQNKYQRETRPTLYIHLSSPNPAPSPPHS